MSHIFISYSTKDQTYADKLADKLRKEGFNVWIAPNKLRTSQAWWQEILKALRTASAVVVIMSPASYASRWVQREIFLADEWGKTVFPVLLEGEKFELYVTTNYADVRGGHLPEQAFYTELGVVIERTDAAKVNNTPVTLNNTEDIKAVENALKQEAPSPDEVVVVMSTLQLVRRFNEEKQQNLPLAREFIEQIAQRKDVPSFFDVEEEWEPLLAEERLKKAHEEAEERLKKAHEEYEALAHHLKTIKSSDSRVKAFRRFVKAYPNFGDPKNLNPLLEEALERARAFTGKKNTDWTPFITTLGEIDASTPLPELEMCLVPVGKFMMGSNDGYDDEKPPHEQVIKTPYWIARYPITNAQWRKGVEAGAVSVPTSISGKAWYEDKRMADCPVVNVTWFEVKRFVEWAKCALPTEPLWEYGARGVEGWVYPWGNTFDGNKVIYRETPEYGGNHPAPVTLLPEGASWVGAMHLSGNVWEWQLSAYAPYEYVADDGREGDLNSPSVRRGLRGGSWVNNSALMRSADRSLDTPDFKENIVGVRCVRF